MVICPDCGKEVPNAKFCKNCGSRLPEVSEVVQPEEEINVESRAVQDDGEVIEANVIKKPHYCYNCGFELDGDYKFCPNCGKDLNARSSVDKSSNDLVNVSGEKNILISIILSIFIPGLGHFYLGLSRKGAMFLLAYIVSAILVLIIIGALLCMVIWIWALVDVIMMTNALNRGEDVEDKLF